MTRAPVQATIEEAFAKGAIDQAAWHARMAAIVVPAYLAGQNPRAQSGYSGTESEWEQARRLVADAIPRSGTLLDVGCASGLLMESVKAWCGERGLVVEPYGVDISPDLAALARARLPQWAERIFDGNAAFWLPPHRFDFVRTGLEYVPAPLRAGFVAHLRANFLLPNGRLLIGPYSEEIDATRSGPSCEEDLRAWGFLVSGKIERPHPKDDRVVRRLLFLD